jgi:hypothetical protein
MMKRRLDSTSVLDLMQLIAATGVGLAWFRNKRHYRNYWWFNRNLALYDTEPSLLIADTVDDFSVVVICIMLAMIFNSSRKRGLFCCGRAMRRELARPGTTACVASLVALSLEITRSLSGVVNEFVKYGIHIEVRRDLYHFILWRSLLPVVDATEIALAIAVAWSIQLASGRWRPVPDLADRAGRCFGVLWIVWSIVRGITTS